MSTRAIRITPDRPLVGDVDLEARIASVPAERTTKGLYFTWLLGQLDEPSVARTWSSLREPPRHGKYQPFLDYPFADALRWLHAVAQARWPRASVLEGLRQLGRETVVVFMESPTGKMLSPLLTGPRDSLLKMPEMWARTDPGNVVTAEQADVRAVRLNVEGFHGWIDCGLVGTLEQVVANHGRVSTIELTLDPSGASRAELVVRWSPVAGTES